MVKRVKPGPDRTGKKPIGKMKAGDYVKAANRARAKLGGRRLPNDDTCSPAAFSSYLNLEGTLNIVGTAASGPGQMCAGCIRLSLPNMVYGCIWKSRPYHIE